MNGNGFCLFGMFQCNEVGQQLLLWAPGLCSHKSTIVSTWREHEPVGQTFTEGALVIFLHSSSESEQWLVSGPWALKTKRTQSGKSDRQPPFRVHPRPCPSYRITLVVQMLQGMECPHNLPGLTATGVTRPTKGKLIVSQFMVQTEQCLLPQAPTPPLNISGGNRDCWPPH